ncbi:MAG: acetylornithine/succinylornithine family transaminase [Christensenellaceae bacterium]|nr:acetylornithine/succinylornithine family transaminase [Christensenellaceae bacterium]
MSFDDIKGLEAEFCFSTYAPHPVCPVSGEGAVLTDTDGKKYTDFLGGIAVNVLGYNNPVWVDAVTTQIKKVATVSNYFYNEFRGQLARELVSGALNKVFISNTGAEANECALKLARKFFSDKGQNRYKILSVYESFHGRTLATVTLTGQPKYNKSYAPLPEGLHEYIPLNDISALNTAFADDAVCAVIIEPILGESGVLEPSYEYLSKLRELCDKTGALLIFDEVQTGAGRTGSLWYFEQLGIIPDIVTGAKGIAGGIPIGVTLAKAAIAAVFAPGDHGTTFGGNPLSCAAGLATIKEIKSKYLVSNVKKGELLKQGLSKLSFVKEVRGKGLLIGAEVKDGINAKDIVTQMLGKGFILNAAGHNTLRFVPPYVITEKQITDMLGELSKIKV